MSAEAHRRAEESSGSGSGWQPRRSPTDNLRHPAFGASLSPENLLQYHQNGGTTRSHRALSLTTVSSVSPIIYPPRPPDFIDFSPLDPALELSSATSISGPVASNHARSDNGSFVEPPFYPNQNGYPTRHTSEAPSFDYRAQGFAPENVVATHPVDFEHMMPNVDAVPTLAVSPEQTSLPINTANIGYRATSNARAGNGHLNPAASPFIPGMSSAYPLGQMRSNLDLSGFSSFNGQNPFGAQTGAENIFYPWQSLMAPFTGYTAHTNGLHYVGQGSNMPLYTPILHSPSPPSFGPDNVWSPELTEFDYSAVASPSLSQHQANQISSFNTGTGQVQSLNLSRPPRDVPALTIDPPEIVISNPPPSPLNPEPILSKQEQAARQSHFHVHALTYDLRWQKLNSKKILCTICQKTYKNKSCWKKHCESEGYTFVCPEATCRYRPGRLDNLQMHVKTTHPHLPKPKRGTARRDLKYP